jgi:hypothetical protein
MLVKINKKNFKKRLKKNVLLELAKTKPKFLDNQWGKSPLQIAWKHYNDLQERKSWTELTMIGLCTPSRNDLPTGQDYLFLRGVQCQCQLIEKQSKTTEEQNSIELPLVYELPKPELAEI